MGYFFAHPGYFYALIAAMLVVSLFVIFSMGEEDRKSRKKYEELLAQQRLRAAELEKTLQEKDKELALSNQMYNGLKGQYEELEEKFSQLFEVPQAQVKLPKIPNLRSTVQQDSVELKLPPKRS